MISDLGIFIEKYPSLKREFVEIFGYKEVETAIKYGQMAPHMGGFCPIIWVHYDDVDPNTDEVDLILDTYKEVTDVYIMKLDHSRRDGPHSDKD